MLIALGIELLSQGSVGNALTAFSEASRISPAQSDAYLELVKAFLHEGDLPKALDAAEKAFRIDPFSTGFNLFRKGLVIRYGDLTK